MNASIPTDTPRQQPLMRPFFVLWTGQALSLLGSQAVQFALIWWLTLETGSATVLATASLFGLLPPIVIGPFAGALVDRWNRKRVMLAADSLVAIASLVLAALFVLGQASIPAVFAALLVRALGATFHSPAMLASTTLMVPERHLTRIQGLNQMVQGGLLIVAAPLGGLLLAIFEMPAIMLVDVGTALVAIVPLLFIAVPQPERAGDASTSEGQRPGAGRAPRSAAVEALARTWADVVEGMRYLKERPGHLGLVGLAMGVNATLIPAFALLPLLVEQVLEGGAADLAWANSAFGVGSIVGGILLGVWGGFRRRMVTAMAGLVALGGATLAVGLSPGALALAASMAAVGIFVPLVNGPIQAAIQATVAPEFQGRVFTLLGSLAGVVAPIGLMLAAPVAEGFGVRAWYVAGAVACTLMGLAGFASPAILGIDAGTGEGADVVAGASDSSPAEPSLAD